MECLKAVMGALKVYELPTTTGDPREYITDKRIYFDKDGPKPNNIQLMEALVKHILQNFATNSYMERHAFVYPLELEFVNTNFLPLIKESFTFNQLQKPTY